MNDRPDVVLVDINLNGKRQGIKLASRIMNEFNIPVIFTTCFDDCETIDEAIGTDPVAYVIKPLNTSKLKAALRLALKKSKNMPEESDAAIILDRVLKKTGSSVVLKKDDREFLQMLTGVVLNKITDHRFDVDHLASSVGASRTGLYRKAKMLDGMSAGKLIRLIRLEQAAILFQESDCSVAKCAYSTGFENLSYFTKCFREYFGILPSEYRSKREL